MPAGSSLSVFPRGPLGAPISPSVAPLAVRKLTPPLTPISGTFSVGFERLPHSHKGRGLRGPGPAPAPLLTDRSPDSEGASWLPALHQQSRERPRLGALLFEVRRTGSDRRMLGEDGGHVPLRILVPQPGAGGEGGGMQSVRMVLVLRLLSGGGVRGGGMRRGGPARGFPN